MSRARARRGSSAVILAISLSLLGSGCLQVDYLLQAAEGQLDLACRARNIEAVVQDESVDPRIRALLSEIGGIKRFAQSQGLSPTDSYEDYVQLEADSVVWVVTAAPELSLEANTFSFPIVGSVPYLGWFDRPLAEQQASRLAAEGFDVDVRGARAYSTLGWFSDPVLSSMIDQGNGAIGSLANTILHESLHATIYVPDQSEFNESLASFVADRTTPTWLAMRYGEESAEKSRYLEEEAYAAALRKRLGQTYAELETLYRSRASRTQKLSRKKAILLAVEQELSLSRPLNNARLSAYDSYNGGEQAFGMLLQACGGKLPRFVSAVRQAKAEDFAGPQTSDLVPVAKRLAKHCAR